MHNTTVPLLINGQEITTAKTLDIFSPSTGQLLHQASCASDDNVLAAISSAQAAFASWSQTSPYTKRDIFLEAARIFESRIDEFAQIEREECGSTEYYVKSFDAALAINGLKDVAGRIGSIGGTVPILGDPARGAMVLKEPYGVVLGIAPW